jgi:hypothetical protein
MLQTPAQVIDVSAWSNDQEFAVYPEGARDKRALFAPEAPSDQFLISGHRYLLKFSVRWAPEQFWNEVLAYRLGRRMGVSVPPSHVAIDRHSGACGALIEFFLDYPGQPEETYIAGGDTMQRLIPQYDRKKGSQHNFSTISTWCRALAQSPQLSFATDWLSYWARVLAFDSLIGNTDRHQDNWGTLFQRSVAKPVARLSPAFDNGTSLGYELSATRMQSLMGSTERLQKYVDAGTHHMRWKLDDAQRTQHGALLKLFCNEYAGYATEVRQCLSLSNAAIEETVNQLRAFQIPVPFSPIRADFVTQLLRFRRDHLLSLL